MEDAMPRIVQTFYLAALFSALSLAATMTATASAATEAHLPPELGWTNQESSFVVHLNIERAAKSILKPLLDDPFNVEDPEDRVWQKLVEVMPLTLGEDVRSATLISVGPLDMDFVTVVRMNERADKLPAIMAEHIPGFRITDIDGHEVHSWAEIVEGQRRHIYGHLRTLSDTERLWIIAANWEHLLDTIAHAERLDRHEHDGFDLPDNLPRPTEHTVLYMYVPQSALRGQAGKLGMNMDHVEWIAIDLGATDTRCIFRMAGGMIGEREAKDLAEVVRGMVAFSRIALRDNEDMKPLIRLIDLARIGADGASVVFEIDVEVELLKEIFEVVKPQISAAREASGRFRLDVGGSMEQPMERDDE
jgi:hypothetical protein